MGAECVGSAALARVDDVWPRIVVAGDGPFSLSSSGSSDSTSRNVWRAAGGGPDGSGGAGRMGWMLEEAPSQVGEPNRLMFSTMEVGEGVLKTEPGYTIDRGAVDREACLARGAGRSHS